MRLEPGLYTTINKGILVCPDDTQTPKNPTPVLTPPANDDNDDDKKMPTYSEWRYMKNMTESTSIYVQIWAFPYI